MKNPYSVKKQSERTLFDVVYRGHFGTLLKDKTFESRKEAKNHADRLAKRDRMLARRTKKEGNR